MRYYLINAKHYLKPDIGYYNHRWGYGIDLTTVLSQIQAVEQNVLGAVKTTDWRQHGDPWVWTGKCHHCVTHTVLGDTYLREAIDYLRAQAGVNAFPWASVPSAAEYGTSSMRTGLNIRHILELRQAIGRISSDSSWKRTVGMWNGSEYVYSGEEDAVQARMDIILSRTFNASWSAQRQEGWSPPEVSYPPYEYGPTEEFVDATYSYVDIIYLNESLLTDDFETAYPAYVASLALGGSESPALGSIYSVHNEKFEEYGAGGYAGGMNTTADYSDSDSGQTATEEYVSETEWKQGSALPTSLADLNGSGSGQYHWIAPAETIPYMIMTTYGEGYTFWEEHYAGAKSQYDGGSRVYSDMPMVVRGNAYCGSIQHAEYQARAYLEGGGGGNWIYWTAPVLPANWPNDIYTTP